MQTGSVSTNGRRESRLDFDGLNVAIQRAFQARAEGPLFTTDAEGLFSAFLTALPVDERQHHTCSACRRFVNEYGGLVTISPETGATTPALWEAMGATEGFGEAIAAMERVVMRALVTGVYLSSRSIWGTPTAGGWSHFWVRHDAPYSGTIQTAGQAMAEKREDFRMLMLALNDYPKSAVNEAVRILEADALYRGEKVLGVAQWLNDLHRAADDRSYRVRHNLAWRAVATAPPGFCHVRASMIGTLLDDITAGLPFDEIRRRFAAKMNPLQYQRPQAPPAAGNIAQAEKIFAQMGLESALRRRFARLDDVEAIWRPEPPTVRETVATGGVFGHLKPKGARPVVTRVELPTRTMTWVKFEAEVLPIAKLIELDVPYSGNFMALVTAVDAEAPPILQWDRADNRNPVSWYVYTNGSNASNWGLSVGFRAVTAVCYQPSAWKGAKSDHHGDSVAFLLEGAVDRRTDQGNALFPENLKSELHSVRATIEAYSRGAKLEGRDEASACGYRLQKDSQTWACTLRVTSLDGGVQTYRLDRWD